MQDNNSNDLPKKVKDKILRNYRRAGRAAFAEYQTQLSKNLKTMEEILRERPKFIPRGIYRFFMNWFVDMKALENISKIKTSDIPNMKALEDYLSTEED